MNAANNPTPIDRDILISRVIDGRAAGHDWLALREAATLDPTIWSDLAMSQDHAARLSTELVSAMALADHVDVPEPGLRLVGGSVNPAALSRLRSGLGWALAAVLALAFSTQFFTKSPDAGNITGGNQAGLISGLSAISTPQQAMDKYLELGKQSGQVVAELPQRYVVESRPAANGDGYEVLYIRQVLERAHVNDVYRMNTDDTGRPVLLPATVKREGGPSL